MPTVADEYSLPFPQRMQERWIRLTSQMNAPEPPRFATKLKEQLQHWDVSHRDLSNRLGVAQTLLKETESLHQAARAEADDARA